MTSSRGRHSWVWILPLLVAFSVALTLANYRFALQMPGGNDFLPRWVAAHAWLVEGVNPYDPQVSLAGQDMIYGRPADRSRGEDLAHFVYPLPAMVFFGPFGLMPYPVARAAWMTVLELGLPGLALLGTRLARWRPSALVMAGMMLFSILWYHGARSVIVGQFAVIEAVLLVGALFAVQRRMDILAGVLLALAMSKPQMAFLVVPYVVIWAIASRRWWLVGSTLASHAVLIVASLLLIPDWPLLWLRQVADYPDYSAHGSPVSIILSVIPRASQWITIVMSGILLAYMLIEWGLSLKGDDRKFQWAAQLTLVVCNLVALRTATTNYVVLIPTVCLVFAIWWERWGRRSAPAILATALLLAVGLWALFLVTVKGNIEGAAMYLPVPLLCLLALWWTRWWARREPRLPLEGIVRG